MTAERAPVSSRQLVLLVLVKEQRATSPWLSDILGWTESAARSCLRNLKQEGLARPIGLEEPSGPGPRRRVFGPTDKTRDALRIPLDTPLEIVPEAPPETKPRRRRERSSSSGSGVIAGKKEIRGYVYWGAQRRMPL